jgi:hypothetical protein
VALLKEYRHKKFYRIQRQYEWFLPDQPDSGTRERWTWYYNMDSTASLKACVYENVSLHDVRETYIFLIDYDAVDVAHMDYALSGPDPLIRRQRAILKECPDCGVILSNKNDEGYKVEVLNSDDFTEIRRTYTAKLYDVMYAILKSAAVTRIDAEHYLLEEQEAYFETGYTITTTIDRIPYEKYKAKIAEQEL